MRLLRNTSFSAIAFIATVLVLTFQNCAPAKLSGDGNVLSQSSTSPSTVGTKADLAWLMAAAAESNTNVLYPSLSVVREARYSVGRPVFENTVIKNNDFSRIEWIQASSSLVISNDVILSPRAFSADMLGMVLIYGYRGQVPYYLGQVRFTGRGATSLNANSVGAVTVNQKSVGSDSLTDSYLIDVDAPDVDVTAIQYTLSSGEIVKNQRGLLLTKKRSEAASVSILLTDSMNQTFSKQLSFPATASSGGTTATPTPTPTPVATPTPTPTPASTPTPTPAATPTPTPALPDLMVSGITWTPATPYAGSAMKFYAIIKNFGTVASPAGTVMSIQFMVDGQAVAISNTNTASLAAGATVTVAANTTWTATAGNHQVTAFVDDIASIAESNETNNKSNATLIVAPALAITSAPAATNVSATSVTINWSLNHAATGQVQYGLNDYASSTTAETSFNYSSHQQTITGLSPGKQYHYRIVSTDQNGSQVTSPDATFVALDNTWTRCALEAGTCAVPGTRVVRYGTGSTFKTMTVTNSVACNNATFGDPAPGLDKFCDYATTESIFHIRTRVNMASYIDAYAATNGIQMQIWSPYTSPTQDFKFTSASELQVFGKCLVATSATSGTALVISDCTGAANQKWIYNNSTGEIKSNGGLCVDLGSSNTTNGTKLTIFTCHGGTNQKWDFIP